jgi:predicted DNA-binding transcriptional regulator YafY
LCSKAIFLQLRARRIQTAAGAVLQRKRLSIGYYNRERDQADVREISPQRLTDKGLRRDRVLGLSQGPNCFGCRSGVI